jgi:LmbE family N-acetylglucosaminyl deacetylase
MKTRKMTFILTGLLITILPLCISGQTDTREQGNQDDITKWTGKTIMWFGPHPDDEGGSMGTLSKLKANGNKIILVMYTTGNKGSRDLEMTSERLAQIRKIEDEKAMGELGIAPDSFIWLGYDDGMLEYVPQLELCEKVCKLIRQYRPDAVFSMDPGSDWMKWNKTDHRMSAFITLDAARAAAYHLYFPSHRIHDGLQPFTVNNYFFYNSGETNYKVDITDVSEKKIKARAWYVSQFGAGNIKYIGPEPDQERLNSQLKRNTERIANGEKIYENFRRLSESMSF